MGILKFLSFAPLMASFSEPRRSKVFANENVQPGLDPKPGRSRGRFKPNQFKTRKARSV